MTQESVRCRNRNRVEFKEMAYFRAQTVAVVEIETEWNLKEIIGKLRKVAIGRNRNRVELKTKYILEIFMLPLGLM